jgi:hypothetical protein
LANLISRSQLKHQVGTKINHLTAFCGDSLFFSALTRAWKELDLNYHTGRHSHLTLLKYQRICMLCLLCYLDVRAAVKNGEMTK